jgi:predicted DNA-binding antitoxin AbrB/MazE fold protein
MSEQIDAIYEQGVFRPLQPVHLSEHEQVSLIVSGVNGASAETPRGDIERQRDALANLRAKMDSLPSGAPQDGLGGADHDQILYGWQK